MLGALAQETRLDAFRTLVQAGPEGIAAGEIARALDIPPPTLSFHLKAMLHADLVSARRVGRSLLYSANFPVLDRVLRYLTENCCQGSEAGCLVPGDLGEASPAEKSARGR